MKIALLSGRANPALAESTANILETSLRPVTVEDFPDGEIHVRISEKLEGRDVYILQSTGPPVEKHLFELLLLADACRHGGAARQTAVIPYLGYARSDQRSRTGEEGIGSRLVADLLSSRFERVICVDLHNPAIEGFFSIPTIHLSAVPLLAESLRSEGNEPVLVAPDLGAVKLVERYADILKLPAAYIHKERSSGSDVRVRRIAGEVVDRTPVIVDDMISTGGTLVSAIQELLNRGCRPPVTAVAAHILLSGNAQERLGRLPIKQIITTDSLPLSSNSRQTIPIKRLGLSRLLAETIESMHAAYMS
jgi:ribose-phosphate pyrophosphokinase